MYDIDRQVYCKSQARVGTIIDRHWGGRAGKRRASYLVEFAPGDDYLTGSDDLRAADQTCDACEKWLPRSSFHGGDVAINPLDGVVEFQACFVCSRQLRREEARHGRWRP